MEQLISMRQRIKAIDSTKKITQAMRLISMSIHSRLRNKKQEFENYKSAFDKLRSKIKINIKASDVITKKNQEKDLIILVGSTKGLCGNFNTNLFKYFEYKYKHNTKDDFIAVGKYAIDYLKMQKFNLINQYLNFTQTNFIQIAYALTSFIIKNHSSYNNIVIYANWPKSFFIQEQLKSVVIPLESEEIEVKESNIDYIFEQTPEEIALTIDEIIISVKIQKLLFDSLLAEQSARFISMDAASKNAENLITTMKLEYNKLRQAIITREISELSSSY